MTSTRPFVRRATPATPCAPASRHGSKPVRALAATVLFALASGLGTAQSKAELDQVQRIKDWGYAIRPIKGWTSIPANAEEKFIVGRWKANLDERWLRGDFEGYQGGQHCELLIVRIPLAAATTAQEGQKQPAEGADKPKEDGKAEDDPFATLRKAHDPKTIEDFIEGRYPGADKRWTRKMLKAGKLTGDLIEFAADAKAIAIGTFRKENVDWAVVYTAFEESYRKEWQDAYLKSIKSFALIEGANVELTSGTRTDPHKLKGAEKRAALKASIAGNPGWYAIDTANYVFLSNSANRAFIESLADQVEKLRAKVYMKLFPPRNKELSLSPVRVLDNESEYYQYGGPPGSAGYFSPSTGELVLFAKFDDLSKGTSMTNCRSVMYHEAFHQYVHFAIGEVSPHSWFDEGHGDYFAGAVIGSGGVRVEPFEWRVRFLRDHLRGGRDLIPLRSLVRLPQREYYANAGLKYAQGWALIYYLRNVSKNKRCQAILDTYFKHVADNIEAFQAEKKKDGKDGLEGERIPGIPGLKVINFKDKAKVEKILSEAVDKAFAGVDLEALDQEFRAWCEKL